MQETDNTIKRLIKTIISYDVIDVLLYILLIAWLIKHVFRWRKKNKENGESAVEYFNNITSKILSRFPFGDMINKSAISIIILGIAGAISVITV